MKQKELTKTFIQIDDKTFGLLVYMQTFQRFNG